MRSESRLVRALLFSLDLVSSSSLHVGWPRRPNLLFLVAVVLGFLTESAAQSDPFATTIRPTEPLSPQEQAQSFHLPPGFTIQLFASEPDIQKPINMAFDARGRLWVSGSTEYPFAAAPNEGRDSISVLEDTDNDGRADKISKFADGLNIPIGLYPYRNGVVAYSIPNIYYFEDTDGDDRADRQTVLYGPFDFSRDTHGMVSSFVRGFDGWLYACHGWANESTVQGADGHVVEMQGGNTFRVRLDGSRIEHFTWGQVNPFGMTIDAHGDLFNADCHSKPITLLLRGGYYDSFGKPHDGLGMVPAVMKHGHGSTAIAGVTWCTGSYFPPEYRGSMFVGNVMTSRVHRDSLVYRGSTMEAKEENDFVTTDDPWFRPVDLQFGPDGALYIADFYNRVIGHYEVPLDHPGRDRHRGRIWRVVYDQAPQATNARDLTGASPAELFSALEHPNLTLRMRATDVLSDRVGKAAVEPLEELLTRTNSAIARVHALWILHRLGSLDDADLVKSASNADALVRVHAMRLLSERGEWPESLRNLAIAGLNDTSALVQRAAADALAPHPDPVQLRPLLAAIRRVDDGDPQLRHVLRMALRNQLRAVSSPLNPPEGTGTLMRLRSEIGDRKNLRILADVSLGLRTEEAGSFLLSYLEEIKTDRELLTRCLRHAARWISEEDLDALADAVQTEFAGNLDEQFSLLTLIQQALQERGLDVMVGVRQWGEKLAGELLDSVKDASLSWKNSPLTDTSGNPWVLRQQSSSDGKEGSFISSQTDDEDSMAILRSPPFEIPGVLRFFICGHLGSPRAPAVPENVVRLRLLDSDEVVAESLPPRSDTADPVEWKLEKQAGKQGYLEIVDGLKLKRFAWLAVGRFDPPVLSLPKVSPHHVVSRQFSAAAIVEGLGLKNLVPRLRRLALADDTDWSVRAAVARALAALKNDARLKVLATVVVEPEIRESLRSEIITVIVDASGDRAMELLDESMRGLSSRIQRRLAERVAASRSGAELLIELLVAGRVPPTLLRSELLRTELQAAHIPGTSDRIAGLVADLPPVNVERERLMAERRAEFATVDTSIERGQQSFGRYCGSCHRVRLSGALVGPTLDGIGNRGLERIVEDVLDPNRNVDPAFRTTVYVLKNGEIVTGLYRRREGKTVVVSDVEGRGRSIPESLILQELRTESSIMPDNWDSIIPANEFYDIVEFLLAQRQEASTSISWRATCVDQKFRSEGVAVADVNGDGKPDILAGEVWYEAPAWSMKEIYEVGDYGDGAKTYSSAFLCYADDINRDGWTDQIVIGFPGHPCHWYENPRGGAGHWKRHLIAESACNEGPLYSDLFGTGRRVLVMAWQPTGQDSEGQMAWFRPGADPTRPWQMHPISTLGTSEHPVPGTRRFSQGLGVGDVNGDGRRDVICTGGWWEQPVSAEANADGTAWKFHAARLGERCANMYTVDMNVDGKVDVVSSSAHDYGIWWHEQKTTVTGESRFVTHNLFPDLVSQTHSMRFEDIDGDGLKDLVTGKRWWAHGPKGDPGSEEPASLHWFQAQRKLDGTLRFAPRLIHNASGVGLNFEVTDINGDGLLDVVTSNKKGVFVFEQTRSDGGKGGAK